MSTPLLNVGEGGEFRVHTVSLSQDTQDPVFRDGSPADLDGLYDPCFLLHLFSELTRPGNRGPPDQKMGRCVCVGVRGAQGPGWGCLALGFVRLISSW